MVESAEGMLEALGYNPGKVDNLFDNDTESAVKAFQQDQQLEETGILTGDTTYALMDAIREKIQKEDPMLLKAKEVLLGTRKKLNNYLKRAGNRQLFSIEEVLNNERCIFI